MTNEIKHQGIVKFAVIIFFIILIAVAAVAVYLSTGNSDSFGSKESFMVIDWYYPELEELAGSSDLIVIATVFDESVVWDTANGKKPPIWKISKTLIYTCHNFDKTDVLKGSVSGLSGRASGLSGRIYGGTIDGYTLNANVPELDAGDTVLLFLKTNTGDNGELISWYHLGMPNVFYETENGTFVNSYYGEITIEEARALSAL